MTAIKFGTDGWRAIIAEDYTNANVARVAKATADWIKNRGGKSSAVIGYDCRFGGLMFAQLTARVLAENGVKVFIDPNFSTTPMVSMGAKQLNAAAGIVITASHNPPSYNGFKIKDGFGGPAVPAEISKIEALIPDSYPEPKESYEHFKSSGLIEEVDLETRYFEHCERILDMDAIRNSNMKLAYDAMYGAGQRVLGRLLPNAKILHNDHNPGFHGQAPEPIAKNLTELSDLLKAGGYSLGLATDGDADRIGMFDGEGNFVDAHHVILLLIHILHKYKGLSGKVVIAFSVSDKVKKLCDHYGIEYQVTKIGFKYICEIMTQEDVLVGGEESGGIAVKGHIPERDGIWDGLVILEHMAKTGKTVRELINEVYEIVGPFSYNRNDLHITNELKQQIIEQCGNGSFSAFGDYSVEKVENIDGFKFHLNRDSSVMIRPSGTEPVLRVYGEAPDPSQVEDVLKATRETILP
jgi:phosphomannomutase